MVVDPRVVLAVEELQQLPIFNGTMRELMRSAEDVESSTETLLALVEADEGFALNVLRFANSAAVARPIRARTMRQALTLLGRRRLVQLALEAETYRFFSHVAGTGGVSRGQMHLHAVAVAACAARAAELVGADAASAHLAGLLHDVGKLLLPLAFGEETIDALATTHRFGSARADAERRRLGVDHAQAGAMLAGRAGLPERVVSAIRLHHARPATPQPAEAALACVQLANALVHATLDGESDESLLGSCLGRLGLPSSVLDDLAEGLLPAARPAPAVDMARVDEAATNDALTGVSDASTWVGRVRDLLRAGAAGGAVVVALERGALRARAQLRLADALLIEVASVLREHGYVGRLGEDEFGVWIAADVADAATAALAIDGALAGLRVKLQPDDPPIAPPVRVGSAVARPSAGDDPAALLAAARRARDGGVAS